MCLLAFRDQVVLQLSLEDTLGAAAGAPPPLTQMLLVLQVHTPGPVQDHTQGVCLSVSSLVCL